MTLRNGTLLGPYEILSLIGSGGMGDVYKARDTRLDRIIAIKVSQARFSDRFQREAHAIAALNHPNICQLYDVGENYLVMEYINGSTLDTLIAKHPLKTRDTLSIAAQVADAAAAAHAAGTLHRDIKPSNIMVTEQGRAKVLDFGLAKTTEPIGTEEVTRTQALDTEDGTVLGTVAYMSPEQAEGGKLDVRSDIFSLGAVLYEMLTRKRPFRGETRVSTMAAILRDEPQLVTDSDGAIPRELERIVMRCLRKDPARRFQTMADLKVALEEVKDETESGKIDLDFARRKPSQFARLPWMAAVVASALIAGGSVWWEFRQEPEATPNWTFRQLTFDSGLTTSPTLSRDGKLLAYASDRSANANLDIYVQQLSGGRPLRLTDNDSDDNDPQFSPDGSHVAFYSARDGGGIYIVPAFGGEARLIARNAIGPRYSPDGKTIAYNSGGTSGTLALWESNIYLVSVEGGKPRKLETGLLWSRNPLWSPDGKFLLIEGFKTAQRNREWFLVPLEGGACVSVEGPRGEFILPTRWLADGTILSVGFNGGLRKVPLDSKSRRFGALQALTVGVGQEHSPASDASGGRIVFAAGNCPVIFGRCLSTGVRARRAGICVDGPTDLRRISIRPPRPTAAYWHIHRTAPEPGTPTFGSWIADENESLSRLPEPTT